jgi:hypothetical protein
MDDSIPFDAAQDEERLQMHVELRRPPTTEYAQPRRYRFASVNPTIS